MTRPHLSWMTVLGICATMLPHVALADDLWNPGFNECAPHTKHANVPAIKKLRYEEARGKILADGWKPSPIRETDGSIKDPDGSGTIYEYGLAAGFWSKGYREVGYCLPTGNAACQFYFVDKSGIKLSVSTVGDQDFIVTGTRLLCRAHQ